MNSCCTTEPFICGTEHGDQHNPSETRSVQYQLDLTNKTATIVWQYPTTTDYSRITSPLLTPTRTHYRYVFTMQQTSDFSASLLFNVGASSEGGFD